MYKRMVFAAAVLCAVFLSFGSAQDTYIPACPSIDTVKDLDINKLVEGSWYEVKMVNLEGYTDIRPRCSMTTFGTDLSVTTEFEAPNKTAYTLKGHLKKLDGKGGFNITFDDIVTSGELPYNVLLVEYDNFVLIYGCTQGGVVNRVNGWILSRYPILSREADEKLMNKLQSMGFYFPFLTYKDVDRAGCKVGAATKTPLVSTATPEAEKTPESPVTSSTPIAGQGSASTQTSPPPTIQLVYGGEGQPGQAETLGYIRSLLVAQWGMLVALLLLGLFVVMSSLVLYRMLLPYLRASHRSEARAVVFAPSDDPKSKKSGHYNDGLEVDV